MAEAEEHTGSQGDCARGSPGKGFMATLANLERFTQCLTVSKIAPGHPLRAVAPAQAGGWCVRGRGCALHAMERAQRERGRAAWAAGCASRLKCGVSAQHIGSSEVPVRVR